MAYFRLLLIILSMSCAWAETSPEPSVVATTAIARALLLNRAIDAPMQHQKVDVEWANDGISGRRSYCVKSSDITVVIDAKTGLPVSYTLNSKYLIGTSVRERIEGDPGEELSKRITERLLLTKPVDSMGYADIGITFSYGTAEVFPDGNVLLRRIANGVQFLDEHAAVTMPYKSVDGLSGMSIRVTDDIALPNVTRDTMIDSEAARQKGFEWLQNSAWAINKTKITPAIQQFRYAGLFYAHDHPKSLQGDDAHSLGPLTQPVSLIYHFTYQTKESVASMRLYVNVDVYTGAVKSVWVP